MGQRRMRTQRSGQRKEQGSVTTATSEGWAVLHLQRSGSPSVSMLSPCKSLNMSPKGLRPPPMPPPAPLLNTLQDHSRLAPRCCSLTAPGCSTSDPSCRAAVCGGLGIQTLPHSSADAPCSMLAAELIRLPYVRASTPAPAPSKQAAASKELLKDSLGSLRVHGGGT